MYKAEKISSGQYEYRGYLIERYQGSYTSWGISKVTDEFMDEARDTLRGAMEYIDRQEDIPCSGDPGRFHREDCYA